MHHGRRQARLGPAATIMSRVFGRPVGIVLVVLLARKASTDTVTVYGYLLGTATLVIADHPDCRRLVTVVLTLVLRPTVVPPATLALSVGFVVVGGFNRVRVGIATSALLPVALAVKDLDQVAGVLHGLVRRGRMTR
jgi:hypothetical protein